MQVEYHCRGCNQRDTVTIDTIELAKKRKTEDFISLVIQHIKETKHTTCPNAHIGVRLKFQ